MSHISSFPQVNISHKPTPLQRLDKLSEKYDADIYCLRDDLTGFGFGGNKTRKLDFLIADAQQKKADTLIAIGDQQSNFCRLAAAAGAFVGMEVHLVLSGERPEEFTGNLLVSSLLEVNIHFVGTASTEEKAIELERELKEKGKKTYRMPSGGSTNIGALGYIEAFEQILRYEKEHQIRFSKIFLASGSGGTQSGLIAGKILYDWAGEIIGISVGRDKENLTAVIQTLVKETLLLVGSNKKLSPSMIYIEDAYIGEGYGLPTDSCKNAIGEFLQLQGIPLDYVYTGKGSGAMLDYLQNGKVKKGETILFIHTGGSVQLFAEPY